MDGDKPDNDSVLDTLSPALKYEALLKERGGPGPTEEKMILVFKVLDQIIPHMGVFTKLMQMCRDEIFEAVYSEQYTGSKPAQTGASKYIQRIPFFLLVKRVYDERDERNEKLQEQLESVKKSLFEKQKQFENATETIENLEQTIVELKKNIADLEQSISDRVEDIDNLEKTLADEIKAAETMKHDLSCDIAELKENLDDINSENSFLREYKSGYEELQQAFQDHSGVEELAPRKKKKTAIATRRAHLVSAVDTCNKMEHQLLTVQNSNIEEFDKFLEDHKSELVQKASEADEMMDMHDVEIDHADQQLQVTQSRFKEGIQNITTELDLLRQHRAGVQEQLQILEENKPSTKKKKKNKQSSRPATQESSLSHGLGGDEDEDNTAMDPFIIQERIFSKFAAMLYTSDNGKTFHEFKGAKYCQSCGEKTVVCPHKILSQEHVFQLPPSATHIKVSRPKVRINMEMMDAIFRPQHSAFDTLMSESPDGKRLHSRVSVSVAQVSPLVESLGETPAESLQTESGVTTLNDPMHFTNTVQRLWEDYKSRTELERTVPRPLPEPRALSLIEQFAAHLVWLDDAHRESETPSHILDTLYLFMTDRYQMPDMAYLVTYDLLTALIQYCPTNKFIWLFTQVLIGNLDASVLRYMLLIGDFINQVDWKTVEDFRAFAGVLYPTLTEDDLETLQMGYISFTENKISKSLVAEYIIYIIMKCREPRFLEMEHALMSSSCQNQGFMVEAEFTEATDHILDVPNNKLRKRLYGETLTYVTSKDNLGQGVPILRLAQITSYLQLMDTSHLVTENITEKVEQSRQQTSEAQDEVKGQKTNEVPSQFKVIGMAEVMTLANNNARRMQCRKIRRRGGLDGD